MPKAAYVCEPEAYCHHYSGHGYIPTFTGDITQQGFGIGGIFANLFRRVLPLLKQNVLPIVKRAAGQVGKNLLTSGANVVKDVVLEKQNIKQSLKRRTKDALHNIIDNIGDSNQTGKGFVRKRKVCPVKRRKLTKDIFD